MFRLALIHVLLFSAPDSTSACRTRVTRDEAVRCAIRTNPDLDAARYALDAASARRDSARVVLPSNPTVSVSFAHRVAMEGDETAFNVYGQLAQELEIAGQRRQRMLGARAEYQRRSAMMSVAERTAAAAALLAYGNAIAALERHTMIERVGTVIDRLAEVAHARASAGVASLVDAELAAAEATRLRQQRVLAKNELRSSQARLATLVGADPEMPLEAVGDLSPLAVTWAESMSRPEIAAADAERAIHDADVVTLKRERIPNPTLSLFAQEDGFRELVLGGGVSFPLPLPAPLGRTNKGRIAEARARAREAEARRTGVLRELRLEMTLAAGDLAARRSASEAFTPSSIERAERTLAELAGEIEAGRMPVRDALLTQQTLLHFLLDAVKARHALYEASVRAAYASGMVMGRGPS